MNMRADRFSKKILATPPSGIRKFFDLIIGRDDIISLGVGEPDFPTPWQLREEAFYHLEKGQTSYTSNWGLFELREEIARYLARYGMYYNPKNEIIATIGGSEAVDAVLRSVLNPGDEIIVCTSRFPNSAMQASFTWIRAKRILFRRRKKSKLRSPNTRKRSCCALRRIRRDA